MSNLDEFGKWIAGLGPEASTLAFAIAVGYFIRWWKRTPNEFIVPAAILCGLILYSLMVPGHSALVIARKISAGTVLSIIGALLGRAAHNKAAVPLADKWPIFSILVCDDDEGACQKPNPPADSTSSSNPQPPTV